MINLIIHTFQLIVLQLIIHVVDRITRLPRNSTPPEVMRILREKIFGVSRTIPWGDTIWGYYLGVGSSASNVSPKLRSCIFFLGGFPLRDPGLEVGTRTEGRDRVPQR